MIIEGGLSERRATNLIGISRSQHRYVSQKKESPELVKAILLIKEKYPFYGVPRVLAVLRRDGFIVNGKRVRRLLKILNLSVPRRIKRKKFTIKPLRELSPAIHVGQVWSMDFVFDRLADSTPFRCFTIVDNLSREVPGILASKSMAGFSPLDYLESLKGKMQLPQHIILDNGPEFANELFVKWSVKNNISLHFIDPGKPVQNAYIESFNGKFRQEFLSQKRFKSIEEVRSGLREWLQYYNEDRPHSSLDYMTPKQFADLEKGVVDRKINLPVLKMG